MERRQFLRLGAVASGVVALGGIGRGTRGTAAAQALAIPTVDRLVMTNVVDNIYDIFAKGGKLDTITVQRAPFAFGVATPVGRVRARLPPGVAARRRAPRGATRLQPHREEPFPQLRVLKLDPTRADALVFSHGHADHYGGLPEYARITQGKTQARPDPLRGWRGHLLSPHGDDAGGRHRGLPWNAGPPVVSKDEGLSARAGQAAGGRGRPRLHHWPDPAAHGFREAPRGGTARSLDRCILPARPRTSGSRRSRRSRASWLPTPSKVSTPPVTT